jgi:hypothetical protein
VVAYLRVRPALRNYVNLARREEKIQTVLLIALPSFAAVEFKPNCIIATPVCSVRVHRGQAEQVVIK